MERVTYEVSGSPNLRIESIGGDLRLTGHLESQLEVQAPSDSGLTVTKGAQDILILSRSSCLVFTPSATSVQGRAIGGDVRIAGLTQDVLVETVGGDVVLRRTGRASFEQIGGDLRARSIQGGVNIDRIGGDAYVEQIVGDLRLRAVGGDVLVRDGAGVMDISCGGDAYLAFNPGSETSSVVNAGGDVTYKLPTDASVSLRLQAGGEIILPPEVEFGSQGAEQTVRFGAGEAELEIFAGGDVRVTQGPASSGSIEDMVFDAMQEMDAKMAEVQAKLGALTEGAIPIDTDRIHAQVQRAVDRAQRKADRMRARVGSESRGWASFRRTPGSKEPVTDDERLVILRMVEQGIVTVEEGEKLLAALEGEK